MLMDRRRGTRYPVRMDCTVTHLSKPRGSLSGQTVNMSNRGVLISLRGAGPFPSLPKVGKPARVILELPQVPYFRGCWLDCSCQVVRMVEEPEALLVAFDVKRYQFRPSSQAPPIKA